MLQDPRDVFISFCVRPCGRRVEVRLCSFRSYNVFLPEVKAYRSIMEQLFVARNLSNSIVSWIIHSLPGLWEIRWYLKLYCRSCTRQSLLFAHEQFLAAWTCLLTCNVLVRPDLIISVLFRVSWILALALKHAVDIDHSVPHSSSIARYVRHQRQEVYRVCGFWLSVLPVRDSQNWHIALQPASKPKKTHESIIRTRAAHAKDVPEIG